MDLMDLGRTSRKTGLKVKQNLKKDPNGMENLNDFFHDGSDSDQDDVKPQIDDGLARRLNFKNGTYKSPKRSMVQDNDDIFAPVSPPDKRNSEDLRSLETLSPISASNSKPSDKYSASLTKKMVLGRAKKRKLKEVHNNDDDDDNNYNKNTRNSLVNQNTDSLFGSDDEEDVKPVIENEEVVTSPKRLTKKSIIEIVSATPTQKDEPRPQPKTKPKSKPKPQPKPKSPPTQKKLNQNPTHTKLTSSQFLNEDGLRKSSRHKIPRLAYWRNEKIVYNTTKENGAVVREVKDVIHVPETTLATHSRTHINHRPTLPKKRKSISAAAAPTEVDYESDPEIEGSEWYKKGTLALDVFEGPGSDKKVERVIAWTSKSEKYISRKTETDNFNLAVLFDQDREFAAAGMLELPMNGVKLMKNNDDTYFMFYVVKGLLEVTIDDTKFITTKGCSFEVPMGNMYQLQNKGRSIAKMFFVQAKYVTIDPNEEWD